MPYEAQGTNSASFHRWEDAQIAGEAASEAFWNEYGADVKDLSAKIEARILAGEDRDEVMEEVCDGFCVGNKLDREDCERFWELMEDWVSVSFKAEAA